MKKSSYEKWIFIADGDLKTRKEDICGNKYFAEIV